MRAKTMSKNYYDDEILFVDVESGDIHLKEGVRRMNYPTLTSDNSTQINYWESAMIDGGEINIVIKCNDKDN